MSFTGIGQLKLLHYKGFNAQVSRSSTEAPVNDPAYWKAEAMLAWCLCRHSTIPEAHECQCRATFCVSRIGHLTRRPL